MTALPTRKLEAYRYADIDALASVWGELDVLPLAEFLGRKRSQRREVGVAPFLVMRGGKGEQLGHAATAS